MDNFDYQAGTGAGVGFGMGYMQGSLNNLNNSDYLDSLDPETQAYIMEHTCEPRSKEEMMRCADELLEQSRSAHEEHDRVSKDKQQR